MKTNTNSKIFCITGKNREGKRFQAIYTNNPEHYNIYIGTLWCVNRQTKKRTKIMNYYN